MDAHRRLVRQAIREVTLSVETLAARLRLSSSALRKYRQGQRGVPPVLLAALARALRAQARRLVQLASALERAGGKQ
jgi:ribosome-binding protein aMBF1 (putative translation factor)